MQTLSVPIVHEGGTHKIPICDLKIDYKKPWVQQHERAIISAYRTSAYFEYYQDELFAILENRYDRLFDLNMVLTKFCLHLTILCGMQKRNLKPFLPLVLMKKPTRRF